MCKFDKNSNYTTTQIAEQIFKVRKYANLHSCRTQVSIYIREHGIKSVNGQVRHGVYGGLDAEAIYNHFIGDRRPVKKSALALAVEANPIKLEPDTSYKVSPDFLKKAKEMTEKLNGLDKLPVEKAIDEAMELAKAQHEEDLADVKRFRKAKFFIDTVSTILYPYEFSEETKIAFINRLAELLKEEA